MIEQSITIFCDECKTAYKLIDCKLVATREKDVSDIVCPNGAHPLGRQKIIETHGSVTLSYRFAAQARIDTTICMAFDL